MQRFFFFLLNIVLKIFRAELGNMSLKELLTDSEENREDRYQILARIMILVIIIVVSTAVGVALIIRYS